MSESTVTLEPLGDREYLARWHMNRYRFLLSDGSTVDVESHTDSSTLRTALLELVSSQGKKDVSIVGVADLTTPKPKPAAPARKRRTIT